MDNRMPALTIEEGQSRDLPQIRALLHDAGLAADVDRLVPCFLVAREDGRVVACAALEEYGCAGLLRSVAVDPSHRNRGLARGLVTALIERAHSRGLAAVYLLTDTAADYFARHGFRTITRAEIRPAVLASEQFRGENCASSTVMVLELSA
jgi:amino-acid N-acetyltransferase